MALAHARASGDGTLLERYVGRFSMMSGNALTSSQYSLMKQWAEYLVNNTMPLDGTQYAVSQYAILLIFPTHQEIELLRTRLRHART